MKKSIICVISFIILATFSACSMSEEIGKTTEDENNIEFLMQDTQESTEAQSDYLKYFGSPMKFNEILFEDDLSMFGESFSLESEMGEDDSITWKGDKEGHIYAEPGYFAYSSDQYCNNYDYLFWDDYGEFREDFGKITENVSEVYGITQEKAIKKVKQIVDKYKISVSNIVAYPLDKDVLEKLSKDYMSDEEFKKDENKLKRNFDKDDEVYLVMMEPTIGEHSLYNMEYNYGKRAYSASEIWSLVNKDNIIYFSASGIYKEKNESETINSILSDKEAYASLENKYKDYFLADKIICNQCKLKYVAICTDGKDNFEFVPTYVFEVKYPFEIDKNGVKEDLAYETVRLLLDAETGEWIE